MPYTEDSRVDIELYDAYAAKCREIFMERRHEHGNHLGKPQFYSACGLAEKCYRVFNDMSKHNPISDDSLVDLVNYAIMVATSKSASEDI